MPVAGLRRLPRRSARRSARLPAVSLKGCPVLELIYTSILVLAFLVIGWFSFYVVYRLYRGQQ